MAITAVCSGDGTVKLTRRGRNDPSKTRCPLLFSRHTSPHPRHGTIAFSVNGGEQPGADGAPHERGSARDRAPIRSVARVRRLEPSHLALALPRRLMRDLRSIVFVLPGAVDRPRHRGLVRRGIAAELVGDRTPRSTALPFQ